MQELIELLGSMSLEELLDEYVKAAESTLAEASLLRLLIVAELDMRING